MVIYKAFFLDMFSWNIQKLKFFCFLIYKISFFSQFLLKILFLPLNPNSIPICLLHTSVDFHFIYVMVTIKNPSCLVMWHSLYDLKTSLALTLSIFLKYHSRSYDSGFLSLSFSFKFFFTFYLAYLILLFI